MCKPPAPSSGPSRSNAPGAVRSTVHLTCVAELDSVRLSVMTVIVTVCWPSARPAYGPQGWPDAPESSLQVNWAAASQESSVNDAPAELVTAGGPLVTATAGMIWIAP